MARRIVIEAFLTYQLGIINMQLQINAQNADVEQGENRPYRDNQEGNRAAVANLIELERLTILIDRHQLVIEVTSACQDVDQGKVRERSKRNQQQISSN